jgi:hypothetical protein
LQQLLASVRWSCCTLKGAKPLLTTGNGQGGVWHVVPLSASDIG